MSLRCFIQEQAPVPGSGAPAVHYPACAWVGDGGELDTHHPLNRFVCSWLTSDVNTTERCQEVISALAQVATGERTQWFADGDAFCVDVSADRVQFNFSHVGPDDVGWWNLAEGRFALAAIQSLLGLWRAYLDREHPRLR